MRLVDPGLELSVDRRADAPLGAQLAAQVREAVRDGRLARGTRLPSVRELAKEARVNVNTARAVYARLESEGLVRSEQGRGTFVASRTSNEAVMRRHLRRQIAQLETALVRLPPPPLPADFPSAPARGGGAALQSTEDLAAIRDRLIERLGALDAQGGDPVVHVEALVQPDRLPRTTPSLAGARIRWVGA
jgi:GntR family transcriptional regulator